MEHAPPPAAHRRHRAPGLLDDRALVARPDRGLRRGRDPAAPHRGRPGRCGRPGSLEPAPGTRDRRRPARARRPPRARHHHRVAHPDPEQRRHLHGRAVRRARDVAQLRRARAVRRPAGAPVAPHRRHARRAAGRPDRLHHAAGPGGRPRAARRLHPAGRGHRRRGVVVALRRDRRPVPHPGLHPAQRPRHQLGPRTRGREGLLLGPHRRDRQHRAGARRDRHRARGRRARRRAHDEHERLRGQRTRHPRGRGAGPDGRPAPRPAPRRGHPAAVGHHARTEADLPPHLGPLPVQRLAVDARGSRDPRVAGRDRRAAPARRRGPRRAAPRVQVRRARRAGLRVDVAAHRGADDADRGRQRLALRPQHPRRHRRPRGHHDGRQHLRLHGCPARRTTPTG